MLIIEAQLNHEGEKHEHVAWQGQLEDHGQDAWLFLDCFKCWLKCLSIYKGYHEAENTLEQLVAEHSQKEIVMVEAHILLEKRKVNGVHHEVLCEVHEDENRGCQVHNLIVDRARSEEGEHTQAIEPWVVTIFTLT